MGNDMGLRFQNLKLDEVEDAKHDEIVEGRRNQRIILCLMFSCLLQIGRCSSCVMWWYKEKREQINSSNSNGNRIKMIEYYKL